MKTRIEQQNKLDALLFKLRGQYPTYNFVEDSMGCTQFHVYVYTTEWQREIVGMGVGEISAKLKAAIAEMEA